VTLTTSTLTALNNLTATGAKNLTATGLTGAGTLTLAGTGSSSTLNTGALGAAASTQAIALTATGWKGGATIGAVDSQDTISLNVEGTTGTVGIGAIGALGAAASPATPAGSVTIKASGALGAVTQTGDIAVGAGKSITVTAKDAIAAISLSDLKVATSSSNPSGSITVDVSGGVASPTVGTMNAATVTVDVSGLIAAPTVGKITALTATYTGEATRTNTRTDTVNNLTFTGGSDVDTVTIVHQDSLATVAGVTATSANAETHALSISTGSGNDVLKFTGYVGQLTATYTGTIALGSGTSDSLTFVASAASTLLDLQALSVTGQDAAIVVTGGAAAATIYGTTGDDAITGGAAADVIFGGTGADVIAGGAGAAIVDKMTGGLGADTFVIIAQTIGAASVDNITDFVGGTDKIKFLAAATFQSVTDDGTIAAAADLDAATAAAYVLATAGNDAGIEALQFTYGGKKYFAIEATATGNEAAAAVVEITGVTGTVVAADFIA
jgi:Ca2+-binding RTX toxin-like protein